jgi:hypothetical protein
LCLAQDISIKCGTSVPFGVTRKLRVMAAIALDGNY